MKIRDKEIEVKDYVSANIPLTLELSEIWGDKIWFKTKNFVNNKQLYVIVQKNKNEFFFFTYIHSWFFEDIKYLFSKEEGKFLFKLIEFLENIINLRRKNAK